MFNGFLMPPSGYIKRFVVDVTGPKIYSDIFRDSSSPFSVFKILGKEPIPLFTLVLIKESGEVVDLGTSDLIISLGGGLNIHDEPFLKREYSFTSNLVGGIKEYNINTKDISNIKSEINTIQQDGKYGFGFNTPKYPFDDPDNANVLDDIVKQFFTYLATILIELDPFE